MNPSPRYRFFPILLLLSLLLLSACSTTRDLIDDAENQGVLRTATADVQPLNGSNVSGTVTLAQIGSRVRVSATLDGLAPGQHGFHIHEGTTCDAPGGHYNPQGSPHSAPDRPSGMRHVGDLGNLVAGDNGRAEYERIDHVVSLFGNQSVVGRAVIVHAGRDQIVPQPSGDAGDMVACGIIRMDEDDM